MEWHVADLIEEDGSTVGEFEAADAIGSGVGKCTFHMAEELTFKESFSHRAGVYGNHGTGHPGRQSMERMRDHLFAGPVLARYQDIGVGGTYTGHSAKQWLHRGRRRNELRPAFSLEQTILSCQTLGLTESAMKLDLGPQDREQPFVFPRLLNEVACAAAHRFYRQVNIGPGRHHDDGSRVVLCNNLRQEIETLAAGSCVPCVIQVDQDGIVRAGSQCFTNQCRRPRRFHLVSLRTQQ